MAVVVGLVVVVAVVVVVLVVVVVVAGHDRYCYHFHSGNVGRFGSLAPTGKSKLAFLCAELPLLPLAAAAEARERNYQKKKEH